jgi:hypothetical protein
VAALRTVVPDVGAGVLALLHSARSAMDAALASRSTNTRGITIRGDPSAPLLFLRFLRTERTPAQNQPGRHRTGDLMTEHTNGRPPDPSRYEVRDPGLPLVAVTRRDADRPGPTSRGPR